MEDSLVDGEPPSDEPSQALLQVISTESTEGRYGFLDRLWNEPLSKSKFMSLEYLPLPAHPSLRFSEAVQREVSKPMRMSSLVSTDYAPLTPVSAPPSFTQFPNALFRTGRSAAELSYSRRASDRGDFASLESVENQINLDAFAPPGYTADDATSAFKEAQLSYLLDAIREAKRGHMTH